jgi:hypothetical protein
VDIPTAFVLAAAEFTIATGKLTRPLWLPGAIIAGADWIAFNRFESGCSLMPSGGMGHPLRS